MVYTLRLIFVVLLFSLPLYLIGSFIAMDFKPSNWLLFSTSLGRVIAIIPIIIIIWAAIVVPLRVAKKEKQEQLLKSTGKTKWQQKLDEMKERYK